MDLSDLPTIVIKVNIGCCESCPAKLGKLLGKKEGVESFDIDTEKGTVTVKGEVDPQILVKNIAKALNKKKTKLIHYELPKEKDSDEETVESHSTQEKIHSGTIEQHVHGNEETHPTHGDHGITTDLHSPHHHNPNFNNHFSPAPPNPHYPPPRASPHHRPNDDMSPHHLPNDDMSPHHRLNADVSPHHRPNADMSPHHRPYADVSPHHRPYADMSPHHRPYADVSPYHRPNDDVMPRHRPNDDMAPRHRPYGDMAPHHQYGYENSRGPVMAYPPNGNDVERPRHVSSTNNACDYFSDENASGCAIM